MGASSAYAIEPIEGVYQLGSAQDWIDFAAVVASDNSAEYNVVFTSDIDLGDNQTTIKGLNGSVDGNGHTLTVAYTNAPTRTAPFATAGNVTIKNLRITGSIASTANCISGFIGNIIKDTSPVIENCVSEVAISTTATSDCHLGGFIGRASDGNGFTVKNSLSKCVYTIPASGKSVGGIVGYGGNSTSIIAKFEKCLVYPTIIIDGDGEPSSTNGLHCFGNKGNISVQSTDNVLIDDNNKWSTYFGSSSVAKRIKSNAAMLTSGELAYTNGWGQNLSVEGGIPSPISTDKVFAVTFKGESDVVVYANASGVATLPSAESLGVSGWVTYTVNGEPFAAGMAISEDTTVNVGVKQPGEDGFYQLATVEDWVGYASLFTASNTESYNARLANDIHLGDNQTMINNFRGTLDGNGHTLTVNYVATALRCAPIVNANDAVIKNLHTAGCINTAFAQAAGILGNVNQNSTVTIDDCSSSIEFMLTMTSGEGVAGGIVSRASDATLLTITNSLFSGKFTFTGADIKNVCSGIVGYSKNAAQTIIKNCLITGSYILPEGVEFDSKTASTYGINSIRRGSATLDNNYARDPENRWACTSQATRLLGSHMLSGEAAYLLQNNQETLHWGQLGLNTADAAETPVLTSDAAARVIKLIVVEQNNGATAQADEDGVVYYANAGGALPAIYAGMTLKTADGSILTEAPEEDATIYAYSRVSSILDIDAEASEVVNVYNLQGIIVRSNIAAECALIDLTPGIYIVNGKKYLVK